jgi:uncharacterized protein YgbK (DUF1537 family)
LAAWWRAQGLLPTPAPLPSAAPAGRIAAVSGSCSPVTARQIEQAEADGFAILRLDLVRALGSDAQAELARVLAAAGAALDQGTSPLIYTARGPDDPAVQAFDATAASAGLSRAEAGQRTGELLAATMRALLERVPALRRIAVAGGDSSGEVAAALGVTALTVAAGLAPGAPLCRAWSADAQRDGLEIVLKGGQMGTPGFFASVRDGTAAQPTG